MADISLPIDAEIKSVEINLHFPINISSRRGA
jgi:hypothetical protein